LAIADAFAHGLAVLGCVLPFPARERAVGGAMLSWPCPPGPRALPAGSHVESLLVDLAHWKIYHRFASKFSLQEHEPK